MQSTKKKWWLTPLGLLITIILIHLLASQTLWIEKIYSAHVYPVIASLLRMLTGWLPFSLGDILYALVLVWVLFAIIQFFRKKPTWKKFFFSVRNVLVKCLWAYLFFLLMWGLNYYRLGIGYKLKIYPGRYDTEDLKIVTIQLRDALNASRKLMDSLHLNYTDNKTTLNQAAALYDTVGKSYPYLIYNHPDVKKMLFGITCNYGGILGYYNPFTGEAQVNTSDVPPFIIPFIACHEIAHQLGFASENEASFVAYLAVKANNSTVFNYSTYFDLFAFANSELKNRDSVAANQNLELLDTLVKKDYIAYRQYLRKYENPIEPLLEVLYSKYLKVHNQPRGIDSYDEIVAWIVAYYKKYGRV